MARESLLESKREGIDHSSRRNEFAEVFEEQASAIHSFFARRGFGPEDCSDLTQETFLRAYHGLARFGDEAEIRSWILRIAQNVWKNALRSRDAEKRSVSKTVSLEEITSRAGPLANLSAPPGHDKASNPLEGVMRSELQRLLREAVEELPPKMRRCVLLRLDRGLKYQEIATLMSISVDTVKVQLYQARQRLKDQLSHHFALDENGDE